ncbi:MAG: aspartate dehydrogenase [Alphaproteobacteria bacterium]|jgi:aspartate dehydrogenase|nr:aspartate dehydrogenase [Alphaproteobacteria bacterium]MDP6515507.1 aspartate dehydrogenase [Alphaproteobacteria bacterium]
MSNDEHVTVAVAGLGAIGMAVARRLDEGVPGLRLTAVSARDQNRARDRVGDFRDPPAVAAAAALAEYGAVVVECAPAAVFETIAEPALRAGRILVPASVGALLARPDLIDLASASGGRILVPTGALLGLDAVRAAAEGTIERVTMITRKPPASLAGAPYLVEHGIRLDDLRAPLKVFDGSARDGARGFPANVNVAAALSLAGVGPDQTRLEIWADPALSRNTHDIVVDADSARLTMTIENVPSADNPRTGRITALSVIAALRGLVGPIRVGT